MNISTTIADPKYTSKSKRNECKNEGCKNSRRSGSAYCQSCSDRHKKLSVV